MTNEEIEKQYEHYFTMFTTEGWKQLMLESSELLVQMNRLDTVKKEEDFNFRRGQVVMLQRLVNFQQGIENSYEDFKSNVDEI